MYTLTYTDLPSLLVVCNNKYIVVVISLFVKLSHIFVAFKKYCMKSVNIN